MIQFTIFHGLLEFLEHFFHLVIVQRSVSRIMLGESAESYHRINKYLFEKYLGQR